MIQNSETLRGKVHWLLLLIDGSNIKYVYRPATVLWSSCEFMHLLNNSRLITD